MKILVIGGSYFLGRAFTLIASKEHELTLINRGTYSMARYGIKEYKADRRDEKALQSIPPENYDVIVDFCAYNPGDIKLILENLKGIPKLAKKYIFISTIDVYERQVGYVKDAAQAAIAACKHTPSHEYNICPNETIGYQEFMEVLSQVSEVPIKLAPISTKEALKEYAEETIYLPFPVTKEEDERYEGSKAERELNIQVY